MDTGYLDDRHKYVQNKRKRSTNPRIFFFISFPLIFSGTSTNCTNIVLLVHFKGLAYLKQPVKIKKNHILRLSIIKCTLSPVEKQPRNNNCYMSAHTPVEFHFTAFPDGDVISLSKFYVYV